MFHKTAKTGSSPAVDSEALRVLLDSRWYSETYKDLRETQIDVARHYLEHGANEGRNPHPLFDTRFYLEKNQDIVTSGINPLVHYAAFGASQGRDPHPLFDTKFYLQQSANGFTSGSIPLVDYLVFGAREGRNPHPLFDVKYYIQQPGVIAPGLDPLVHYVTLGAKAGRNPHPLFDTEFYLEHNPDVAKAGVNPLIHYVTTGAREGRAPHPLFDLFCYQEQAADLAISGMNPLMHYLTFGTKKGYNPHPLFDTKFYLEHNRDVDAAGTNALIHYLLFGAANGRDPNPMFDTRFYVEKNPDIRASRVNPLVHYVRWGAKKGCDPHPNFSHRYYTSTYLDIPSDGFRPLAHYLKYGRGEGRRTTLEISGEVTTAELNCVKPMHAPSGELALFVTHSPHGRLKPHVLHHLKMLKQHGVGAVLIVAADAPFSETDKCLDLVESLYVRENIGFDFAAWAHILRTNPQLFSLPALYLVNDSIVGPLNEQHFSAVLRRIRTSIADVVGLTDNYERGWHIQSYFIALKPKALASKVFQDFVKTIKNLREKQDVINLYETRFAPELKSAGLSCEVLFSGRDDRNVTICHWKALLESGFPYIKMEALRNAPPLLDKGDLRCVAGDLLFPSEKISPDRDTVVVIVHDASRSGAPILAWNIVVELQKRYNVVALLKHGGAIEHAFYDSAAAVVCLSNDFPLEGNHIEAVVDRVVRVYSPKYVVANSVETRHFVPDFEKRGVPVVALVHEFSSYLKPNGVLDSLFKSASEIVFPTQLVADTAIKDYKILEVRGFKVLAQGASKVPSISNQSTQSAPAEADAEPLQLKNRVDSLLVVGIGTIEFRKGVDIFLSTAALVRRAMPDQRVQFAWVGKCLPNDALYLEFLKEQIQRSGLAEAFVFVGETDDLEAVYAQADVLFLPSRLDPLPNVAIDAALEGIPVICFDQASGIAEILKESEHTRNLVLPHLDAEAAAQLICELARDPARLAKFSKAIRPVAEMRFNMARYINEIDKLGRNATTLPPQVERDNITILESGAFNANLYLGWVASAPMVSKGLLGYLKASRLAVPRNRPRTGLLVRRPLEGFHPLIYASDNPHFDEASGEDPLAHYLRTGKPAGRWTHQVVKPSCGQTGMKTNLSVAVHAHFHYPELLPDFVKRLKRNVAAFDFFVTTTSTSKAAELCKLAAVSDIERTTIIVVPNRGRDIGPMLSGLGNKVLSNYDIVGHFHGKRTPQYAPQVGEGWRNFLWEHLIGDEFPMMDLVLAEFEKDECLGLVFAEDPHLSDWDDNRTFAEELARRMGIPLPLPNHFDFPHGTMFWARTAALTPLFDLRLSYNDYPAEPLPGDGTILHAIERLLPVLAEKAGFRYAATHLERWTR